MQTTSQTTCREIKHDNRYHSVTINCIIMCSSIVDIADCTNSGSVVIAAVPFDALSLELSPSGTFSFPHWYFANKILHVMFVCTISPTE